MGVLLPGEGEPGEEGLIAIRFGICETFTIVGGLGRLGGVARRGAGGEVFSPALELLSSGMLIMWTLPG